MSKFIVVLACLASLAAAGIIDRDIRKGNVVTHKQIGIDRVYTMTQDELLRQKFVLDVLYQVQLPLKNLDLFNVDQKIDIDENMFVGNLDDDMLYVLNLLRTDRMLGHNDICTINDIEHVRQFIGLYRLMVCCRDFQQLQRFVIYVRKTVNCELFVRSFIMALQDRHDTHMLYIPSLYEILPQIFYDDGLIREVQNMVIDKSTKRTGLFDVMGLVGRGGQMLQDKYRGGLVDRTKLWTPFADMHRQLKINKFLGGRQIQSFDYNNDNVVVDVTGRLRKECNDCNIDMDRGVGLLADDIGLRSFIDILVDELIVKQVGLEKMRGLNGVGHKMGKYMNDDSFGMDHSIKYKDMMLNRDIDIDRDNVMMDRNTNILGRNRMLNRDINTYGGIYKDDFKSNGFGMMDRDYKYGIGGQNTGRFDMMDRDYKYGIRGQNTGRFDMMDRDYNYGIEGKSIKQNPFLGRRGVTDLPVTDINNDRLLHVNRKRLQNLDYSDNYDTGMMGTKNTNRFYNTDDYDRDNYLSEVRNTKFDRYTDNDDVTVDRDMMFNRFTGNDKYMNRKNIGLNRVYGNKIDMDYNDDYTRHGFGIKDRDYNYGIRGQGVKSNIFDRYTQDDDVDTVDRDMLFNRFNVNGRVGLTRGKYMNRQNMGLTDLPTTTIDNDRLLHVNRRRLDTDDNIVNRMDYNRMNVDCDDLNDDRCRFGNTRNFGVGIDVDRVQGRDNRRFRRSLDVDTVINRNVLIKGLIRGDVFLQYIQQLVARLNMERIALGQVNDLKQIDTLQYRNNDRLITNPGERLALRLNAMNIGNKFNRIGLQKVNEIINNFEGILQQRVQKVFNICDDLHCVLNEIGDVLIVDVGLVDIVRNVVQGQNGRLCNMLNDRMIHLLLKRIVDIVDRQVVMFPRQDITDNFGVTINNIKVDKLRTFVEYTETDLSNMLNINLDVDRNNRKVVLGRVARLNHKDFNVNVDITCDRQQQVIMRTFIGPKLDVTDLNEQRKNFILLDLTTVDLKQGRNLVVCNSKDITWTGRDTTPFTVIYERVMRAIQGNVDFTHQTLIDQTNLFPHRLLLPRGRMDGLPMQMLVVITPVDDVTSNRLMKIDTFNGLDTLLLDSLPFNYPLDRDVNVNDLLQRQNIILKDVVIYHDDKY